MAENTKIEWADHTFNPWIGCTKVSPACDHCYAEADFATRRKVVQWGAGQPRKHTAPSTWAMPLRWNAKAELLGVRYRVFCASLADVFDNEVPVQWRRDLFDLISATPSLDWLLLTKRIGNARSMYAGAYLDSARAWPANVWIGATIANQAEADRDVPKLLAVPAAKRFLSMEPLLGDVRLGSWLQRSPSAAFAAGRVTPDMPAWTRFGSTAIDWVIVGGESGPNARPMHPDWARSLRDQCQAAGVPFLFKQWGEWAEVEDCGAPEVFDPEEAEDMGFDARTDCVITPNGRVYRDPMDLPDDEPGRWMRRIGKKAAGRLLDGRTWDEVPS